MTIAVLIVLGLCLGSFVNALVWRLHENSKKKTVGKNNLSIINGRSMCPNCRHTLSPLDLMPVISWMYLKGRCRYCNKKISPQYPLVELATTLVFVLSYIYWPSSINGAQVWLFSLWLIEAVLFMSLIVYDLRWYLLPNRLIYPLGAVSLLSALITVFNSNSIPKGILYELLATVIGGGLFYILFQVSDGKWIGGGDVKLGWVLGLIAGTPSRAILFLFLASLTGSLVSAPFLVSNKLKRTSLIPFGPFLIIGIMITQLFGASILHWYNQLLIS